MQPLVLSPNWWTWNARSALASWPLMSHEMLVETPSFACSKVTVPASLESPRRTATAESQLFVGFHWPLRVYQRRMRIPEKKE